MDVHDAAGLVMAGVVRDVNGKCAKRGLVPATLTVVDEASPVDDRVFDTLEQRPLPSTSDIERDADGFPIGRRFKPKDPDSEVVAGAFAATDAGLKPLAEVPKIGDDGDE